MCWRTSSSNELMAQVLDGLGDVLLGHDVEALLEDDLALVIHHVVVLEDLLADVEVARLDLLLRHLQGLVHPGMGDRLAFLQAERLQDAVHALRPEDAHQVVLERQVELGAAGVALAAGAAAQLVVDAPALVALGARARRGRRLPAPASSSRPRRPAGARASWRSAPRRACVPACVSSAIQSLSR